MRNVYEQVARNRRRSVIIVGFFVVFTVGSIFLISQSLNYGWGGTIFAFLYTIVASLVTYFAGDKLVLTLSGAHPVEKHNEFDLYTVTENLSLAAQMPTPNIYVIEESALNAFATGRNPKQASICVTRGLLEKLDRTELSGVIGHELSHIKNRDTLLFVIVAILIGTLVILSRLLRRSMFFGRNRKEGGNFLGLVGLLLAIFTPLIGQLIKLAISRQREYLADADSAKLTRQPSGLIRALEKITNDHQVPKSASPATAHFYIDNPFRTGNKLSWVANLFNTHPPIEKRLDQLKKMV